MQDNKEIPTATCMFSGLGNSVALLGRLYFKTGSQNFKMAAAKLEVPVSHLLHKIAQKL
jgi:hypothetical protein